MNRRCARPGCGNEAAATLSYAYAEGAVVLEDLSVDPHPMVHDLCALHADSLSVPRGWDLSDNRARTRSGSCSGASAGHAASGQLDLIGA